MPEGRQCLVETRHLRKWASSKAEKALSLLREACRESLQSARHQALSFAIDGGRFRKPPRTGQMRHIERRCFLVPM
eukprot:3479953-Amphidinium_carterae.1